jgi:ketosteroid isomerase-like protein
LRIASSFVLLLGFIGGPGNRGGRDLKFHASKVEVAKSGNVAYTQGTYTVTLTDPQTRQLINDHRSYVTTYRKQPDGTWKAVADIVTSDVPPPTPPPSHT